MFRTGPQLRRTLERWLAAEQEPQTRLDAVRAAAEVRRIADEVLEQRVVEARSFHHSWSDIAAAVGVTRQSAHRRWRHVEDLAARLRAERELAFRSRRVAAAQPEAAPRANDWSRFRDAPDEPRASRTDWVPHWEE